MYSEKNPNANHKSPVPPPPLFGQPVATRYPIQQRIASSWSSGLCGCCSDVPNCCLTCWCPCITFGKIAEIVDEGSTSCGGSGTLYAFLMLFGCCCIYSFCYRSKMRRKYNLLESPCNDFGVHFCC